MSPPHEFSVERAVMDRLDEVIAESSDDLAITDSEGRISYRRLGAESERIAAGILSHPSAAVARRAAILCPTRIGSIAGILGILRAGKAWVPLDPHDPSARLAEKWHDAGAPPILCSGSDEARVRGFAHSSSVVVTDQLRNGSLPRSAVRPQREAYLLYTSGSTGAPKGVIQSQRNLLYHARTYAQSLSLEKRDRVAVVASLAVDAALMDVFGSLVTGASMHLWDTRCLGVEGLADWLETHDITVYHSTPTLFRFFTRELSRGRGLPKLRRVVLGGEPAHREDFDRFRSVCKEGAVLINGLGPTESTLALQAFFTHTSKLDRGTLPIGYPVAGTQVLLRPEAGSEAEDSGQLVIRSPYVALGYWRRPELSKAAFQRDAEDGSIRLFLTGDRARRLADGSFVFLGRCDERIKIHGVSIEPAEIEMRLRSYAGLAEAALVLTENPSGEPIATAFVRAAPGAVVSESELLARLRRELPAAMVPSRIVRLESFPILPSGKIDRRRLKTILPHRSDGPPIHTETAPVGPVETWLLATFADLLGVASVSLDDDFFALGGHSLLAVRLLARAHETFGLDLPLSALFDAPTPKALALRLTGSVDPAESQGPIRPIPRDGSLPLSFGQERLLFHDRLAPSDPSYHVPTLMRLHGPIDPQGLRDALDDVVSRHEALRTTLAVEGGVPTARISRRAAFSFDVVPLFEVEKGDRMDRALVEARRSARLPFDISRGPLLRATLFELTPDESLFLVTVHHIAVDGWSTKLIFGELSTAYAHRCGRSRSATEPAAPRPIDYPDYAAWQRRTLEGMRSTRLRAYWSARLADAPALELPTDSPRPALPSRRGDCCPFEIPKTLAERLRKLAREARVTPYVALLATYAVLLGRHADQQEVVIASPVAGRTHPDVHDMVGTFINTVALRLDLSGNPTVRELLQRAKRTFVDALANADLPFEQVVSDFAKHRDPASEPLAQAMFILHQGEPAKLEVGGIESTPVEIHLGVSMFDLTLTVRDDERMTAWFEYACDLFDESTALRIRDRWLHLLSEISCDLDRPLSEIDLIPRPERHFLICEFNQTDRAYDLKRSVGSRIMATASMHPERVAVVSGDEELRYDELQNWSHSVAAELASHGVVPQEFVPVILGRGVGLVPALVGVLAAGAAFVPIDPTWPEARLRAVLARLEAHSVVVDEAHASLSALEGVPRTVVGPLRKDGAKRPQPRPFGQGDDPVYGFFTSGSTAEPKLAMIAHRGLSNRFAWMDDTFGREAVTLQTTPHMFDSAVWQLLWPLCSGGRSVVPHGLATLTASEITLAIERHGVTIVDFVPSVLDALLPDLLDDPGLSSLRDVIVGGEAIQPETLRRLHRALPRVRVTNLYGPTEATIGCIAEVLDPREIEAFVPMGRPIANVRAVVLDSQRRLLPIGVPGELYLTGACLGLGYFADAEATRRVFLDNPVADLAGGTVYRTSDRVRLRRCGRLEFLGRCDDQMKIRGLRIDPREIEAVLLGHPSVHEAFVGSVVSPATGELMLYAWVAPLPLSPELLPYLRDRLPTTLIPARVSACSALARLPSGKVDRRLLATMAEVAEGGQRDGPASPPCGPTEQRVAEIWRQHLGVEVDRTVSFFEAGGNSLLALRVHAELQRRFGRDLLLVDLFRYPTIADFSAYLDGTTRPAPRGPDLARRNRVLESRRGKRKGGT